MYRCICGAVFDRPAKKCERVSHGDGIREQGFRFWCPSCGLGEPYFEEIEEGEESEHLRN